MKEIQLKDAKATLSAVVDEAVSGRRGRKEAVIISLEEYQRLASVPSFGRLLAAFPREAGDIPPRRRNPPRDVDR